MQRSYNLWFMLISLTLLCIGAQVSFFAIHYKVSDLLDSFVQSSLRSDMFHLTILLPIIAFLITQLTSYVMFVLWVWFVSVSCSEFFRFSNSQTFWFGLLVWLIHCSLILILNNYFFPDSFFAKLLPASNFLLWSFLSLFCLMSVLAYSNAFWYRRHILLASIFLVLGCIFTGFSISEKVEAHVTSHSTTSHQPNIILIGLDSLRPDFVNYFNKRSIATPHIDNFLKSSVSFTEAYTPLARTFPAWMSILTAKYPLHSNARTNLADPEVLAANDTLAKKLKQAGYETIYATDEKRFSNITERYGFDRIIGPGMGVDDFILGGLSDFPLTNLMINTGLGRVIFPYNYGNRAAAITYEPDKFLQLVKIGLADRSNKPLFLAIHLCITHWPFTWAQDKQSDQFTLSERYASSVVAVDKQLGELLQILKKDGLLEHSLVVLLSDHGTTVGMHNDRIINEKNYLGERDKIKMLPIFKLSSASNTSNHSTIDYSLDTSYGQGTDVLSLKQYHVLLAFQGFGIPITPAQIDVRTSLLDISPTILDFMQLTPLSESDGISLQSCLFNHCENLDNRALFLETGHSLSDIESKDIFIDQVVKHAIGLYKVNSHTGQLIVKASAEKSVNLSKQRAILWNDWLLSRYPAQVKDKLVQDGTGHLILKSYVVPDFYVIANVKTGQWAIGLDSSLARSAPAELLQQLNRFYGDELNQ